MEIVLGIVAVVVVAAAGIIITRNKKLERALIDFAKEIQANPELQAEEKKIQKKVADKAASVVTEKLNKVTKNK